MSTIPKLPDIPEEERTPLVVALLEIIQLQQEQIQALKDEIARLKGQNPKPTIRPSKLEKKSKRKKKKGRKNRPGSDKRKKTKKLEIHETVMVRPDNIPEGSKFKGYQNYTVQDIIFKPHNTVYRLERWKTPKGDYLVGKVPDEVAVNHFGLTLVSFILYQYHHAHVTQPLILEQLQEIGVDISTGQVNRIITEGKEIFHEEKNEILRTGLQISAYINVDDTGARHNGKNGFCTHIGNERFAWFKSTDSKSRINFLKLLSGETRGYMLNVDALEYMRAQKLPEFQLKHLVAQKKKYYADERSWKAALRALKFISKRHIRIATEGALLGSILKHGLNPEFIIVSDDAGQFNILQHALCWIHAERAINRLDGFTEKDRRALEKKREQIWRFYAALKKYRKNPSEKRKVKLEKRFDKIFDSKTCYATLNKALKRLYQNKAELLLVLKYPNIPLHNNTSERDIREYVKKRKISGSSRSAVGRQCRDTFASLKKTSRKLEVSFWEYLQDRVSGRKKIPLLCDLMRQRAQEISL